MNQLEETFLYDRRKIMVKEYETGVQMSVDERYHEWVEPQENGFLTGAESEISKLFNQQGAILIPSERAKVFLDRLFKRRLKRDKGEVKKWIDEYGAAHAGILYGEIEPRKKKGWYIVLMMKVSRFGGYIDYVQPRYEFLGEHPLCEKIRLERGVDAVYHRDGEFYVTLVSAEEAERLLRSRRI